jgi:uncharacterized protein YutE (UPF0331/DUF86 family)
VAPVDREKLRSHLDHLRGDLRRLERVRDEGRSAFLENEVSQAAATRWLQTAVEAMIDVANHVIAREGFGVPKAYSDSMEILVRKGVLPADHRDTLVAMVRFRNRVVHLYDELSAEDIWDIIDRDLGDFETFVAAIVERYFADPPQD